MAAAGARVARWPWWAQAGGLYVVARLVSACIFMAAALHQGVNPWFPAQARLLEFHQHLGRPLVRRSPAKRLSGRVCPPTVPVTSGRTPGPSTRSFPCWEGSLAGLTGMAPAWSLTVDRHGLRTGRRPRGLQHLPAQGQPPHGIVGDGFLLDLSRLTGPPGAVCGVPEPSASRHRTLARAAAPVSLGRARRCC